MDERDWAKELGKLVRNKKFYVLTRYSKSGMTRWVDVYWADNTGFYFLNFYLKKAGARLSFNKDGSIVMSGWGYSEIPEICDAIKDCLKKHKLKVPNYCLQHKFNTVKLP